MPTTTQTATKAAAFKVTVSRLTYDSFANVPNAELITDFSILNTGAQVKVAAFVMGSLGVTIVKAAAMRTLLLAARPTKSALFKALMAVNPTKAAAMRVKITKQTTRAATFRLMRAGMSRTEAATFNILLGRVPTKSAAMKMFLLGRPTKAATYRRLFANQSVQLAAMMRLELAGAGLSKGATFQSMRRNAITKAAAMNLRSARVTTKGGTFRMLRSIASPPAVRDAGFKVGLTRAATLNAARRVLLIRALTEAATFQLGNARSQTLAAAMRSLLAGRAISRDAAYAIALILVQPPIQLASYYRTLLADRAFTRSAAFNQFVTQYGLTKAAALKVLVGGSSTLQSAFRNLLQYVMVRDSNYRVALVQMATLSAAMMVMAQPSQTLAAAMRMRAPRSVSMAATFQVGSSPIISPPGWDVSIDNVTDPDRLWDWDALIADGTIIFLEGSLVPQETIEGAFIPQETITGSFVE